MQNKLHLLLGFVLFRSVFAAPLQARDVKYTPSQLRFEDIQKSILKGDYGKTENIDQINTAITSARTALVANGQPLAPSLEHTTYKQKFLKVLEAKQKPAVFLHKVLAQSPKGPVLHVHFNAVLPRAQVWKMAVEEPGTKIPDLYVQFAVKGFAAVKNSNGTYPCIDAKPAELGNLIATSLRMNLAMKEELKKTCNLGPMYSLEAIRKRSKTQYESLKSQFLDKQILLPARTSSTTDLAKLAESNWARFNDQGTVSWKYFFYYKPFLAAYTKEVIQQGIAQNIFWQEWRFTFLGSPVLVIQEGNKWKPLSGEDGITAYLDVIQNEINQAKKSNPKFKGAIIIWCLTRQFGPDKVVNAGQIKLLNDIRNRKSEGEYQYRRLIAGLDVVGNEDGSTNGTNWQPTSVFIDDLDTVMNDIKAHGDDSDRYPFVVPLHAGESLSERAKDNVEFAIKYQSKFLEKGEFAGLPVKVRIGHGFNLDENPDLFKKIDSNGITVESCPVSNEFLSTADNPEVSAAKYMKMLQELSFTYNPDDPTYQNSDATDEPMFLLRGSKDFKLAHLIAPSVMAIDGSAMTSKEKAAAHSENQKNWKQFVSTVLA